MVSIKRLRNQIKAEIKADIKNFIGQQFESPTEDFIRFLLSSVDEEGDIQEADIQQFTETVKQALKQFLNEQQAQPTKNKPKKIKGNKTFTFEDQKTKLNSYDACLCKYLEILFDRYGKEKFEGVLHVNFGQQKPYFSKDPDKLTHPQQIREDIDIYVKFPFGPKTVCKIIERLANYFECPKPTIEPY